MTPPVPISRLEHLASSFSRRSSGFTLLEAVLASLIVGAMFVAALNTVGVSRLSQFKISQRSFAQQLAADLLAEILGKAYADPGSTPSFGCETGESNTARDSFDDVDDYADWSASPPQNEDGTDVSGSSGWKRAVVIEWVDPTDPSLVRDSESGAKRITVSVSYNSIPMASVTGIRSASGW